MHTFQSIAAQADCSKRTVQTWWEKAKTAHGELGTIAGEGQPRVFTDHEVALLVTYRSNRSKPSPPNAQKVDVTVETGNHCRALVNPEINGATFSLDHFRADDIEALVFDDPDAIAVTALEVMDQIIQGMDADIKVREQRLQKTRAAQDKVTAKAQELQLEKRLYRDRARDLDTAQTTGTQALQDAMVTLQTLGKPAANPPGASG